MRCNCLDDSEGFSVWILWRILITLQEVIFMMQNIFITKYVTILLRSTSKKSGNRELKVDDEYDLNLDVDKAYNVWFAADKIK